MKKIGLFLFFLGCFSLIGTAQIEEKYIGKMLSLNEEKAYLSFDKPYYTSGEMVFFKAFVVHATSHVLDTLPTVLYIDFSDINSKQILAQQKLKIENGIAFGSFNTEGVKGTIFIHAYTRWMSNLNPDFHFNKSLQIFPPIDASALAKKSDNAANAKNFDGNASVRKSQNEVVSQPSKVVIKDVKKVKNCQFFPESSNLLLDFANRVAFKATDDEGKGIGIKGFIRNEKGDSLTKFEDTFLGMGRFNLVIKKDEKYTAEILNADGTTSQFPLPETQQKGAILTVDNRSDTGDLKVVCFVNFDTLTMPNTFYLLVHQRGKVCFYSPILVKNKSNLRTFKVPIPHNVFNEEGIATVTLFDEKGKPLAERLTFIRQKKRTISIAIKTQKNIFEKRERVTVDIETKTPTGEPIAADLSFSVTNDDKIAPPQYLEDLRAYLLLRSDLRGYIEQPNFYFQDTTAKARFALDNLMMTQGWRRFNWFEKSDSVVNKRELGLSAQGIVRSRKTPAENAAILLLLQREDNRVQSIFAQTDKKGRFIARNLDFLDSTLLYVNIANSSKTYTVEPDLTRPTPSVSEPKIFIPDAPKGNLTTYLEASQAVLLGEKLRVEKEITLQEFVVKEKKIDPFEGDSRLSYSMTDRTYTIDENEHGTVLTYLEFKFIKHETNEDGEIQLMHGRGDISGGHYAIIVDGFLQSDGRILSSMQMDDVQRIDIISMGNGGYMTGFGTEGVVHILTKSGDPNYWKKYGKNLKSDIPTLVLQGYTTPKQFYVPDYAQKKPEYLTPDHRTTIYWSPIVHTDASGKTSVSFYTTDDTQTAKIIVEGIDKTGKIGIGNSGFKVN